MQIQDMLMQEQIIMLVKEINSGQKSVGEMTAAILYNSLCIYHNNTRYLSLLYKLIFHTYTVNSDAAYSILSGFVKFGQTDTGKRYKPMLDYFAIAAFDGLLRLGGAAIIKPCVNHLRATIYNLTAEPLLKHIVERIVEQLKMDITDIPYNSDLCCYLPHEKSFSWGWFSHIIARTYFFDTKYEKNIRIGGKKMRKYMMCYRKLIINLRRHALEFARKHARANASELLPTVPTYAKIEENWISILQTLEISDYEWTTNSITACLTPIPEEEVSTGADEAVANACEAVACEAAVANEAVAGEAVANASEAVADEAAADEAVEAADSETEKISPTSGETAPAEKNKGWLYSLFGWA
jgi:hypothetical protein